MADPIEVKFNTQRTVVHDDQEFLVIMTPAWLHMVTPDGLRPAYLYISKADGIGYVREQADMESRFTLKPVL